MGITLTITEKIKTKQLTCYGHVQRMDERRLPRQILKWQLRSRRRPGKVRRNWKEGTEDDLRNDGHR